jgi:hypothetical protein
LKYIPKIVVVLSLHFCVTDLRAATQAAWIAAEHLFLSPDLRSLWTGTGEGTAAREDPNGGYIFKYEFSFGNHSEKYLFVASDRFGPRFGLMGSVYCTTKDGSWNKMRGTLFIHEKFVYMDNAKRYFTRLDPDRFTESMTCEVSDFSVSGMIRVSEYRVEQPSEGDVQKLLPEENKVIPEIYKVPLAAFLRNPDVEWRRYNINFTAAAQSLDEGDRDLLAGNMEMSWKEAEALFQAHEARRKAAGQTPGDIPVPPELKQPVVPTSTAPAGVTPANPADLPVGVIGWGKRTIYSITAIIAVVIVLWRVLRRRGA